MVVATSTREGLNDYDLDEEQKIVQKILRDHLNKFGNLCAML